MDTLVIQSRTRSNARLLSTIARKLGDMVFEDSRKNRTDLSIHHASESVLAKDWLTKEEDLAWKDL